MMDASAVLVDPKIKPGTVAAALDHVMQLAM